MKAEIILVTGGMWASVKDAVEGTTFRSTIVPDWCHTRGRPEG